ncbi:hypothetical protein MMC22_003721 [Lobaria immixta]|nr:hypothetical protein [Lobaria immixta]
MRFRSFSPSNFGSTITAFFLTAIINATVASPAPGPVEYSLSNVRRELMNSPGCQPEDEFFQPAMNASWFPAYIPPDKCLFYSLGLHEEAKTFAEKNRLCTVWGMYPDQPVPQIQKYTDRERECFYRALAYQFAKFCSGKGWYMPADHSCPDSILTQIEQGAFGKSSTGVSSWNPIPPPYNGPDFTAAGGNAVALPDWNNSTVLDQICKDPRRFSGTDPHNYWGN